MFPKLANFRVFSKYTNWDIMPFMVVSQVFTAGTLWSIQITEFQDSAFQYIQKLKQCYYYYSLNINLPQYLKPLNKVSHFILLNCFRSFLELHDFYFSMEHNHEVFAFLFTKISYKVLTALHILQYMKKCVIQKLKSACPLLLAILNIKIQEHSS